MTIIHKAIFYYIAIASLQAQDAAKLYEQNCMACHQLENQNPPIVGPSLVEINHIYKNKLKDFIQWCKVPGKKRKNAIHMPSMAHIGDKGLSDIYCYIKKITDGKKWKPKRALTTDKFRLVGEAANEPRIQRIFLPNSSPASIAITLDGQHSLCWDTLSCRLRYIWKGGFIDGSPYWKTNGNNLAIIMGEIYYTSPSATHSGFTIESNTNPKFAGYEIVDKLPTFTYKVGSMLVKETYKNDNGAISIHFSLDNAPSSVSYSLGDLSDTNLTYSKGFIENNKLTLTADEAHNFILTFEPKL